LKYSYLFDGGKMYDTSARKMENEEVTLLMLFPELGNKMWNIM
jgi:hypothetical protein